MELSTALEGRYFLWAICHCSYSHLLAVRCVQYCSVFNHNIGKLLPVNHLLWERKVLFYIQSTFTGVLEKVAFLGLMRIFKVMTGCDMLLIKLQCIDHCWCKEMLSVWKLRLKAKQTRLLSSSAAGEWLKRHKWVEVPPHVCYYL